MTQLKLHTIGHSSRTLEEFLAVLEAWRLHQVVDVRRYPRSKRHPHFSGGTLSAALEHSGLRYSHAEVLGGYRHEREHSPNTALEGALRGYADHLSDLGFARGYRRLLEIASKRSVVLMCAELDWRDCHRRMIADRLTVDGHEVVHVRDAERSEPHELHPCARVEDGELTYPGQRQLGLFD